MRCLLLAASILVTFGCARAAQPHFFNGHYYMAGDANCVRIRALSPTRIMCVDDDGVDTGYRDAMTDQQLWMYMEYARQEREQIEQLGQSFKQAGESIRNSGFQYLERSQQYQAPAVAPIPPPGGYQTRCLVNGRYVSCRSNDAYTGGTQTNCVQVGNTLHCRSY